MLEFPSVLAMDVGTGDIEAGTPESAHADPFALVLKRMYPTLTPAVERDSVMFYRAQIQLPLWGKVWPPIRRAMPGGLYILSDHAIRFIYRFDRGVPVYPGVYLAYNLRGGGGDEWMR